MKTTWKALAPYAFGLGLWTKNGRIANVEIVPEVASHPDHEAALAAARKAASG